MNRARTVVLVGAVLAAAGALAFVAARGPKTPESLQDRVRAVASTLRCPVCQDLSVADSPSSVARQMRATIGTELRAGETPARIRAGFVRAYGQWILLAPPRQGIDLIAWVAPVLLALLGLVLAVRAVRRWTFGSSSSSPDGSLAPGDRRLLENALSSLEDEAE
jgi:cytochrome c-type biogenesis protein CcmH